MTALVARPSILRGIPLDRHAVIEASAGTGKTFALEHLVVQLVVAGDVPLDRLLVVTFTEKATNELRARIRAKLEELDRGAGRPATPEEVRAGDAWLIDDGARHKLSRAVRAFDGATITTIHAFCQGVLRDNAFASGRLFEEEQVDGRDAFGRAMRDALRREVAGDPKRGPWLEAALARGWSIQRIEDLLWRCSSVRAELRPVVDIRELTRALQAMPVVDVGDRHLVEAMRSWGVHASTARAVGTRIFELSEAVVQARRRGDLPGYVAAASRIDLEKIVTGLAGVVPAAGPAAVACIAAAELAARTPPFPAALAAAVLPPTLDTLVRTKREAGRYDFDDMLSLLDEALAGPRGAALAASMRRRFSHALIDEFQDTDETQWSIFRRAFFAPAAGARSTVFLVGDPKQSIYRFRGADVHTYLRAGGELAAAGATRVTLDRNFRSTAALVDAQNVLFGPESAEPIFDGPIPYVPVACGRPDRALVDGAGRPLSAVHVLRVRGEPSLEALGEVIAREIRTAIDPASPWRFDDKPLELHDFFVLTRTTREGRVVGGALRRAGIAHAYFKEEGLFQTDEARDLLAVLYAIADPDDRACRLAAWLTPFFGVSLGAVERARDVHSGHPLVERLRGWKHLADARDFGRLFEALVRESGVVRRQIFFADGEREVTNYLHLLELLLEHARAGHVTLTELCAELAGLIAQTRLPLRLEGNVQRLESERRAVQIMTIHKSKGLEAPVVFVAGGASQPRSDDVRVYHEGGRRRAWIGEPSSEVKPLVKAEEAEEDQRLVYVAFTRAQGRLYVPCLVDDGGRPKKLRRAAYDRMNRRVAEVVASPRALFTVEDVARPRVTGGDAGGGDPGSSAFRPAADWFVGDDRAARHDALRRAHAGLALTSYTRMKKSWSSGAFGDPARAIEEEAFAEHTAHELPVLGPTRSSGVFLHELLERVPIESFAATRELDGWRSRPEVSRVIDEAMAVHRVDPAQRDHAERLVWTAYTTPVTLPSGAVLAAGLSGASRIVREMAFIFANGNANGNNGLRGAGDRVLVRGAVDLAFEHEGLTYFVDWKSDSMPSYAPGAVAQRVAERYEGQLRLYALAVARLLGIASPEDHAARFGGVLYCFLRGFGPDGAGLYVERPSHESMLAWAHELEAWSPEEEP
jgi:exodeoxyribonuclease V beta subunit